MPSRYGRFPKLAELTTDIISGTVGLWNGKDRVLTFTFDNGYVWEASIRKIAGGRKSDVNWSRAQTAVAKLLDDYYYGLVELDPYGLLEQEEEVA